MKLSSIRVTSVTWSSRTSGTSWAVNHSAYSRNRSRARGLAVVRVVEPVGLRVSADVEPGPRRRHVRTVGLGLQEHADRAVGAPGVHRSTCDEMVYTTSSEMRGHRQTKRSRADNEHIGSLHRSSFKYVRGSG